VARALTVSKRHAGADADDGVDGSEDASPEDGDGDASEDEPPSGIRRKTGHGTTGKPGKRLTLEDLQAHFGVSLQVCSWSLPRLTGQAAFAGVERTMTRSEQQPTQRP
jgi:hypothetical protein